MHSYKLSGYASAPITIGLDPESLRTPDRIPGYQTEQGKKALRSLVWVGLMNGHMLWWLSASTPPCAMHAAARKHTAGRFALDPG